MEKRQSRNSQRLSIPAKGIFWFTCSIDSAGKCDFTDSEIIARRIPCDLNGNPLYKQDFNSKNQLNFTHERSWLSLVERRKDLRRYSWNYFPRGRVEIKNQRAYLFVNPHILECPDFKKRIIRYFDLTDIWPMKVIPDHSAHYHCFIDGQGD